MAGRDPEVGWLAMLRPQDPITTGSSALQRDAVLFLLYNCCMTRMQALLIAMACA